MTAYNQYTIQSVARNLANGINQGGDGLAEFMLRNAATIASILEYVAPDVEEAPEGKLERANELLDRINIQCNAVGHPVGGIDELKHILQLCLQSGKPVTVTDASAPINQQLIEALNWARVLIKFHVQPGGCVEINGDVRTGETIYFMIVKASAALDIKQ